MFSWNYLHSFSVFDPVSEMPCTPFLLVYSFMLEDELSSSSISLMKGGNILFEFPSCLKMFLFCPNTWLIIWWSSTHRSFGWNSDYWVYLKNLPYIFFSHSVNSVSTRHNSEYFHQLPVHLWYTYVGSSYQTNQYRLTFRRKQLAFCRRQSFCCCRFRGGFQGC